MRAGQLKEQEKTYKDRLPQHMQPLMQKKRLLLLQEMLESVNYPDKQVVEDLAQGFNITGWQSKTRVFPQCVKRPQFSVSALKQMAHGLNRTILHS